MNKQREFRIDVPGQVLDRIDAKICDARPGYAPADDGDWKYGTSVAYLSALIEHWRDRYDWRAHERALNDLPQFKAEIDGLDIHFYHVRGAPGGFPIILTHGWPGSVVEFQEVMPLLVARGFDVIVPSLPGYGWSGRPATPIGPGAVAALWRKLMTDVLGYRRFGAQGGDWGSAVTARLGAEHADVVAAIHLNLFMPPPPTGDDPPDVVDYWTRLKVLQERESGYMHEQATKPQTIGLALHDNPVGWAAWVIEKFASWSGAKGDPDRAFGKDRLITNLMTYLVNEAIPSAIWMYHAAGREPRSAGRIAVPTGLALYPGEFYPYPARPAAERAYNVARWSEMPAGGHFAAMEQPHAFSADVGAFFADFA